MTFSVRLTAEAEDNVRGIRDWIAERSHDGALRWLDTFDHAQQRLREGADQFALAAEADAFDEDLREISFKPRRGNVYRALFVIRGTIVHIVSVRGSGQDWLKSGANVVEVDSHMPMYLTIPLTTNAYITRSAARRLTWNRTPCFKCRSSTHSPTNSKPRSASFGWRMRSRSERSMTL